MLKKIIIGVIITAIVVSAAVIYLNRVYLPVKIKSLIVKQIEDATGKKAVLGVVKFNFFKGLVLKDLVLYEDNEAIIQVKEIACGLLIPPLFKKKIIIPFLTIDSPRLLLVRGKDATFNLQDLFVKKTAPAKSAFDTFAALSVNPERAEASRRIDIVVLRFVVKNGKLDFRDEYISPAFSRAMEGINIRATFSLPDSVRFKANSGVKQKEGLRISAEGDFNISKQILQSKVNILDFSCQEFSPYFSGTGLIFNQAKINTALDIVYSKEMAQITVNATSKGLTVKKENLEANINALFLGQCGYSPLSKKATYSGEITLTQSSLLGVPGAGTIDDISGPVAFKNDEVSSNRLTASVFKVPCSLEFKLKDFKQPVLEVKLTADSRLEQIKKIITGATEINIPLDLSGEARVVAQLKSALPFEAQPVINGYIDLEGATLKSKEMPKPLEEIRGRIEFSSNQLTWNGLKFAYQGNSFISSGVLTNFENPGIKINLSSSQGLELKALCALQNKRISFSEITGRYLNSLFSATGDLYYGEPNEMQLSGQGKVGLDLKDMQVIFAQYKDKLQQVKPQGVVNLNFNFSGNINDPKTCMVKAEIKSDSLSAYGLRSGALAATYLQERGICDILLQQLVFYDGNITGQAKVNLTSANLPYWAELSLQGLKLEKLKLDTTAKNEDISGNIEAQLKLNGFSDDLSKLSGAGSIFISEGKFWELNLFKGLGELIFTKDFGNIKFNEGWCSFIVENKEISTNDLILKSLLANIKGQGSIGFDGSIDAALNVQVNEENAPLSGSLKDVFTIVVGEAGRFGVIYVSGTIKEPKFKFKTAVVDIFKSLRDTFLGKPAKEQ